MHSGCLLPQMLAVLTSAHQPRARERVGTQVWAWQSMRGQAYVDMRGPTPGLQRTCVWRACTAAKDSAAPRIGR